VLPGRRQPAHLGAPTLSALPYSRAVRNLGSKNERAAAAGACKPMSQQAQKVKRRGCSRPQPTVLPPGECRQQRKKQQQQRCSQDPRPSKMVDLGTNAFVILLTMLIKNIRSSMPLGTGFVHLLKNKIKQKIMWQISYARPTAATVPTPLTLVFLRTCVSRLTHAPATSFLCVSDSRDSACACEPLSSLPHTLAAHPAGLYYI
jgi:hypothetical protein